MSIARVVALSVAVMLVQACSTVSPGRDDGKSSAASAFEFHADNSVALNQGDRWSWNVHPRSVALGVELGGEMHNATELQLLEPVGEQVRVVFRDERELIVARDSVRWSECSWLGQCHPSVAAGDREGHFHVLGAMRDSDLSRATLRQSPQSMTQYGLAALPNLADGAIHFLHGSQRTALEVRLAQLNSVWRGAQSGQASR